MKEASRIKVLEICGGLSTEGIGMFLLNTFENIDQGKFEIHFALATKYQQVFENRIISKGGKIHRTYEIGEGLKGKLKHCINLYKLIKKDKYEVVHSHMDFFNGLNLLVAFLAKAPLRISHAHVAEKETNSITQKVYYFFMKLLINIFSNKKLGCSQNANMNINSGGKVIFNGINLTRFNKHNFFPKDVFLDVNKKNIVTVGRIDDQKNPFFIVEIIKALSNIDDNFHFYWIGEGSLKKEIDKKIEEYNILKHITFLGIRNDVEKLLPKMNLFLMPSKYEGFPIVLVEAQASGLKCLISDNITNEINFGLCYKLSLKNNEVLWAKKIIEIANENKTTNVDLHKIDIKSTILTLQNEYHYI